MAPKSEPQKKITRPPTRTPIPAAMAEGSPDAWEEYFEKNRPDAGAVCEMVLKLQTAKKHTHIVALLEAALLNGQLQPWMYEALAVSMEVVGRPQEEIERVLLSSVDFSTMDIPSMLYAATYLKEYGRHARALQLLQQASKLDRTRPEPYGLSLPLATKLKDSAAIQWAATGILSHVWVKNYELIHKEAVNAILNQEQILRQAGKKDEADQILAAMAAARQRDIVLELSWTGNADLDMAVEEPAGAVCAFDRQRTVGGGVFVRDGYGPDPKNTSELCLWPEGLTGDYRVKVHHQWGTVVGKRATLKIIRHQGTPQETTESVFVDIGEQDKVVRVALKDGRLKAPLNTPVLTEPLTTTPRKRNWREIANSKEGRQERIEMLRRQLAQLGRGTPPVGYQPVVTLIREGVQQSAMAVVSPDRRYVRLSLNPVFSALTDVQTFSFLSSGGTGRN